MTANTEIRPGDPLTIRFLNFYRHCGQEWEDIWSCTCNDRCPICDDEIEPLYAEYIGPWWLRLEIDPSNTKEFGPYDTENQALNALKHLQTVAFEPDYCTERTYRIHRDDETPGRC